MQRKASTHDNNTQRLSIVTITTTTVYSSQTLVEARSSAPSEGPQLGFIRYVVIFVHVPMIQPVGTKPVIPSLPPYTNILPPTQLLPSSSCTSPASDHASPFFQSASRDCFSPHSAALLGWVISENITKYPKIVDPALREKAEADGKIEKVANGGTVGGHVFDVNDVRLVLTFLFFRASWILWNWEVSGLVLLGSYY
ncbi:hypothetical protein P691DRAFT_297215 [Macrolepiota fuliginosa MF-IS2]|uniref:Uncharacterized protein n=1 Tax=Macrolepiota fuliginosa MF-IS2 TaxID=1400762 RepID=A0A9P5X5Q5_9AGAR|nr:hypothetical protein P691DRAFT_297215 [Macrolepiota fuliginosa MF-IS2]